MTVGPSRHCSPEVGAPVDVCERPDAGVLLDETAFPSFETLVLASQEYARHSGCRFRSSSFDGVPGFDGRFDEVKEAQPLVIGAQRSKDRGPVLRAKLRAAPVAAEFMRRLRSGDAALRQDLDSAFDTDTEESVRNAMVAAFQRLGMWPPCPPPPGVADEDCNYEDLSAPLDVIAQRTYNDAVCRATGTSEGRADRRFQRAMTAAFLVDFAHEAGVELPPMPERQQHRFHRFAEMAAEAEAALPQDGLNGEPKPEDSGNLLQFLAENKKMAALTAVSVITLGPVVTAGIFLARRALQQRGSAAAPCSCASEASTDTDVVDRLGPGYAA